MKLYHLHFEKITENIGPKFRVPTEVPCSDGTRKNLILSIFGEEKPSASPKNPPLGEACHLTIKYNSRILYKPKRIIKKSHEKKNQTF